MRELASIALAQSCSHRCNIVRCTSDGATESPVPLSLFWVDSGAWRDAAAAADGRIKRCRRRARGTHGRRDENGSNTTRAAVTVSLGPRSPRARPPVSASAQLVVPDPLVLAAPRACWRALPPAADAGCGDLSPAARA